MIKMNRKGLQGATFGIMDGVIGMIGTMMGLSVTGNRFVVLIGIMAAGVANALANASGIHVSQETELHHSKKEVMKSTIFSFFSTISVVILLSLPLIFFNVGSAIIISLAFALIILALLGYIVSKINIRHNTPRLIAEYVFIGIIVSLICYGLGQIVPLISPTL